MSKYYDYFEEQEHNPDEVTMDEFIAEAMRTDLKFNTLEEELQYQRTSRIRCKMAVISDRRKKSKNLHTLLDKLSDFCLLKCF